MPASSAVDAPQPVIFVAGATGYTGRAVVKAACERGLATVAHVRPGSARGATLVPQLRGWGAEVLERPWELEALRQAIDAHGVTHVFSLLGITAAGAKREQARLGGERPSYDAVDKGLTLMLHTACEAAAVPPRFVYLSSLGADTPGGSAYMKARFDVEAALRAGSVPWLSVRPAFISGPDRDEARPLERFGAVVADALLGLVGMLGATATRDRYATTTGEELGRLMLETALEAEGPGRVVDMAELRRA